MVCLQICKQICFLQNALFQHDCNLNHSYAFHFYDLFSSLGSGPLGFFRYFIGRKLVCVRIVPTLCKKMSVAESNPSVGFGEEHGKCRKCRYCGSWSTQQSPWQLEGTPLSAWAPNVPWGRGKKDAPVGSICKPCVIVSQLKLC